MSSEVEKAQTELGHPVSDDATFKRRLVREPGFTRYTVDSSTVHQIGDEIEVALLNLSPALKEIEWRSGSTQPVSVEIGGSVVELCRLRMDAEAAHNLSFNLLLLLARMDELSVETLEANVQKVIDYLKQQKQDD